MPFLPRFLPRNQRINLGNSFLLIELFDRHGTSEEGVDIEFSGLGALAQELEDPFYPAHELREEAVVVRVDLVHEFVEVVFVSLTEVDEGLDCLVGVGGDILFAAFVDNLFSSAIVISKEMVAEGTYCDHIVDEDSKVCNTVVDIRRLVNPNKRLIEDRKQISQKL